MNDVFNHATGIAFQAVLANSLHFNFSDLGIIAAAIQLDPSQWQSHMLGTINSVRGVQEVNGYVQAFFDFALKGTPSRAVCADLSHVVFATSTAPISWTLFDGELRLVMLS